MNLRYIISIVLFLAVLLSVGQAVETNKTSSISNDNNLTYFSLTDLLFQRASGQEMKENSPINITDYCRYTEGTVLAWNLVDWQGKGEYSGEVLGKVLGYNTIFLGTGLSENSSPSYLISLHPFYRSQISSIPDNLTEGSLLAYYPCSYLDNRTKAWNEETDWECSLIKDENGTVIGKSNQSGLYRLEKGHIIEGDPTIKVPEVPPDPLEFYNTLLPWMRFEYDDETHDNILSLGIEEARTLKGYTLEDKDGVRQKVMPSNGSIFLLVYLEVVNRGHESFTGNYMALNPDASSYRLFFRGYNYTSVPVEGRILSGTYRWDSYKETSLDRYEHMWGALLFIVPESINLSQTYFQSDLGLRGKPMWHLE